MARPSAPEEASVYSLTDTAGVEVAWFSGDARGLVEVTEALSKALGVGIAAWPLFTVVLSDGLVHLARGGHVNAVCGRARVSNADTVEATVTCEACLAEVTRER